MEAVPGQGQLSADASTIRGTAAELHALEPSSARREVWHLEVDRPALVLGSTQSPAVVRADADIEVVRRRSGGGAVLMIPGEVLWTDVIVPRDDPRWDDDVARAMWWVGEAWACALRAAGVEAVEVHRGPLVSTAWSPLICFDGLGAGEVTVAGRKAVGISQRRTRSWARIQTVAHLVWRPDDVVDLLSPPRPTGTELTPVWTAEGVDPAALRRDLAGTLAS